MRPCRLIIVVALTFGAVAHAQEAKRPGNVGSFPDIGMNPMSDGSARTDRKFADIVVDPDNVVVREIDVRTLKFEGPDYRIDPGPGRIRVDKATQSLVLKSLRAADQVPSPRLAHYSWCDRRDLAIVGWSSRVDAIERTPRGLLVEVRVSPKLVHASSVCCATFDYYVESYLFDKDMKFRFLGGVPAKGSYRGSFFGL